MTPLSNITGKQMIRFVQSQGYFQVRQRGSHQRFKHPDKQSITLPVSGKKVIKPGIVKGLLNTMGLKSEILFQFLKY